MSFEVRIRSSGHRFTARPDQTVLDAALQAGLVLPFGCRDGACGSCRSLVVSGTVDHGRYAARALSDADRAKGHALMCQAVAQSDLVIDVRDVRLTSDVPLRNLMVRVNRITAVADDVMIVHLGMPVGERLKFLAGQYLDVLLRDGRRRSFSLANAPHDDTTLELHIRRVKDGSFTGHVFTRLRERDILRVEAPLGSFFLRDDDQRPIVFVASGTGFAPIKSILEHAFHIGLKRPMTLYWGARRPKDLYHDALVRRWTEEQPQFRYVPVISEAVDEDRWDGRTGFVHRAVMQDLPDLSAHRVYACGVPVMVDSARRDFVQSCALPEDEFFADAFTTEGDRTKLPTADAAIDEHQGLRSPTSRSAAQQDEA